jgi:hypothetical protein
MARYDSKERKAKATVHTKDGDEKFPIGDKSHAVQAMRDLGRAKPPLDSSEKHTVEARAAKYGVGPLAKGKKKKPTIKKAS